jgi:hypothetical protein
MESAALCVQACTTEKNHVRCVAVNGACMRDAAATVAVSKVCIDLCSKHLEKCNNSDCLKVCEATIDACQKVVNAGTYAIKICKECVDHEGEKEYANRCAQACEKASTAYAECIDVCEQCINSSCC